MKKVLFMTALVATTIISCKKDEGTVATPTTYTFSTDAIVVTDSVIVNYSSTKPFSLYSFEDTSLVANSDSNSSSWDFGLRYVTFIVNSLSSGPGNAAAQVVTANYETTNAFDITGLRKDTTVSNRAITGSSWYVYANQNFTPIAGKTFLFRTAQTGKYVKMEMLSAVAMGPFLGTPPTPTSLKYKFRYTLQK